MPTVAAAAVVAVAAAVAVAVAAAADGDARVVAEWWPPVECTVPLHFDRSFDGVDGSTRCYRDDWPGMLRRLRLLLLLPDNHRRRYCCGTRLD
uniref:Putative secreted protein n=1 Tax=Anopheles darlingi TaxID=43151 RepID=A0A2M4D153_ANODA